jgi:hypothetical protein
MSLCSIQATDRLRERTAVRAPRVAQRSFAAANVRLTAIGNDLRRSTNCSVGIVMRRTCNGIAGATVTVDKPREGRKRLVSYP